MESHFGTNVMLKSKQNINLCYQCKKCGAGCPVGDIMQYKNYEILRLIQLGHKNSVFQSNSPWVCVSCKACSARCPNGIDTAKIMDVLKEEMLHAKAPIAEKKIVVFHKSFLQTVNLFGRLFELGLIGIYKMKTGTFTQDMALGMKMMKCNKLHFLPIRISRCGEIRRIFSQAREHEQ